MGTFKNFLEEQQNIAGFTFIKPERAQNDVVILANLLRLDADWQKDTNSYIGPQGNSNQIGNRYKQFGEWTKKKLPIKMPEVSITNGIPFFTNGRHRTAWLRDQGAACIPFSVEKESAQEFEKKYGCQ